MPQPLHPEPGNAARTTAWEGQSDGATLFVSDAHSPVDRRVFPPATVLSLAYRRSIRVDSGFDDGVRVVDVESGRSGNVYLRTIRERVGDNGLKNECRGSVAGSFRGVGFVDSCEGVVQRFEVFEEPRDKGRDSLGTLNRIEVLPPKQGIVPEVLGVLVGARRVTRGVHLFDQFESVL